jgi:hypothetical protein
MPIQILLVNDNPGDVRLMREVLLGVNNSVHLLVASDGVEAMGATEKNELRDAVDGGFWAASAGRNSGQRTQSAAHNSLHFSVNRGVTGQIPWS